MNPWRALVRAVLTELTVWQAASAARVEAFALRIDPAEQFNTHVDQALALFDINDPTSEPYTPPEFAGMDDADLEWLDTVSWGNA